jgi:hypothetical protein
MIATCTYTNTGMDLFVAREWNRPSQPCLFALVIRRRNSDYNRSVLG